MCTPGDGIKNETGDFVWCQLRRFFFGRVLGVRTVEMEKKNFSTVLHVPKVWRSLLEIESLDDLTAFLEASPPPEAVETDGLIRADWPRPFRHDRREVSFQEDEYTVCLGLFSGNENYFTMASIVFPNGDRYAHTKVFRRIYPVEVLEISGVGTFVWSQEVG